MAAFDVEVDTKDRKELFPPGAIQWLCGTFGSSYWIGVIVGVGGCV